MTPQEFLITINAHVPSRIWALVDNLCAQRGKGLPDWPQHVFLPFNGWYAALCELLHKSSLDVGDISALQKLAAVGTWRLTQDFVRFDPDVYHSIVETPLTGDLPCDIFLQLPAWSIWVETQGMEFCGLRVAGFFAMLDYDVNTEATELRLFYLDDTDADHAHMHPVVLEFGEGSIEDALRRVVERGETRNLLPPELAQEFRQVEVDNAIKQALSLLLYVCAYGFPSVGGGSGSGVHRPQPKKTKKGWRLFPAQRVSYRDMGQDIGEAIRAYRASSRTQEVGTHTSPRPHVRRAHWHGYWHGPIKPREGDDTPRRFVLIWLPPIPVAMGEDSAATSVNKGR